LFAKLLPNQELHDMRILENAFTDWKQIPEFTDAPTPSVHCYLRGDVALHSVIDIGDDDLLLYAQESVDYWTKNAGDLPTSFTAEDCEDLLATLDFASSLA
jgi:hypothetical protein